MKRNIILANLLLMVFFSCFNSSKTEIIINDQISIEVKSRILDTLNNERDCSYYFMNKRHLTSYINDILYQPPIDTISFKNYEASWVQKGDTTLILGNDARPDGAIWI